MNSILTYLTNKPRLIIAFLTLLGLVLGALQLHPHLGVFNDDAEYLVLGDALASGQGYTWANDPLQPPHNKYPPGYPLAVAGVVALTGSADDVYDGIIPVKLLTLLAFAGALILLWLLLSRLQREPGIEPLLAVGLFAVNPFVLEYAVQIMSELPYTFVSLLTLLVAARYVGVSGHSLAKLVPRPIRHSLAKLDPRPIRYSLARLVPRPIRHSLAKLDPRPNRHSRESGNPSSGAGDSAETLNQEVPVGSPAEQGGASSLSWQRLLVLALLAALCYYLRGVGATVAVSLVLWLLLHRQLRGAIVVGGVSVVLIGLWQVRNAIALPVNIYSYQFFLKDQEDYYAGTIGLADLLARIASNVEHYVLAGFLDVNRPGLSVMVAAAAGCGWLIAAFGWGVQLRRQISLVAVYTFVYLGVILVWPYASGRFLIPVIPFLGYYGLFGGRVLVERVFSARFTQFALGVGVTALICLLVVANVTLIRTNLDRWSADPAEYYRFDPQWSTYLQSAAWLRENIGENDVIMARRHFAMYVYSGRLTAKYRYDTDDYEMGYLLSGTATKFVVEDAFAGARGDFSQLPPALAARNGSLKLVHATPREPPVRVWRLIRPPRAEAE